jgi:hypothetical protein
MATALICRLFTNVRRNALSRTSQTGCQTGRGPSTESLRSVVDMHYSEVSCAVGNMGCINSWVLRIQVLIVVSGLAGAGTVSRMFLQVWRQRAALCVSR